MNYLLYAIAAAVLIPIIWFVVRAGIGNLISLETARYAYLQQTLKNANLLQHVPAECLRECTAECIKYIKRVAVFDRSGKSKRFHLVEQLDLFVFMFREWINSNDPFDKPDQREFRVIFERHKVPRLT